MAPITSKQRDDLPPSKFAIPPDKYPIDTRERAANALARVSQFGSPEEKAQVRKAVCKLYPDFGVCQSMKIADRLKGGKR
jgi:hypothetical protein